MNLIRNSKLLLASLVLAVGGLGVAATVTPAAHAASQPTIAATGLAGEVEVRGSGFTPSGTVWVGVFDPTNHLLTSQNVVASPTLRYCNRVTHICYTLSPGGTFDTYIHLTYVGYVRALAADDATSTWSNWSTTYVRILP